MFSLHFTDKKEVYIRNEMEGKIISSLLGTLERANRGARTSVKWGASTNMGPQNNVVQENMLLP